MNRAEARADLGLHVRHKGTVRTLVVLSPDDTARLDDPVTVWSSEYVPITELERIPGQARPKVKTCKVCSGPAGRWCP